MSRIGNKPIEIPANVQVEMLENHSAQVKGPKGTLVQKLHPDIHLKIAGNQATIEANAQNPKSKALKGLFRILLFNMVQGVTVGHKKSLEIIGIGYNAELKHQAIKLNIGKSHITYVKLPPEIRAEIESVKRGKSAITYIHFFGIDKELVGNVAAQVRKQKPPEPYISKRDNKSKGIRYTNELHIGKVKKSA